MTLTLDLDLEARREGVDDGRADAVQTARDRVPATAELSTGVQDGEDDLDGRLALGAVHVDRDAATVVDHAHGAVAEDRHLDGVAVAGEGLVDGVVDDLLHEVVQAALTGGADVHARALADRLETFEHLDGVCPVLVGNLLAGRFGFLGNAVGVFGRHGYARSRSVRRNLHPIAEGPSKWLVRPNAGINRVKPGSTMAQP